MQMLRSIVGISQFDRIRSSQIRKQYNIQDIVKWVRMRRVLEGWHRRMDNIRIAKKQWCRSPTPEDHQKDSLTTKKTPIRGWMSNTGLYPKWEEEEEKEELMKSF